MTARSRSIAGRVAVITGAASGMGRATAELFASEGALVAMLDVDAGALERSAAELVATGATVMAWAVDVSDLTAVHHAIAGVRASLGPVDILVNNAGVARRGTFTQSTEDYMSLWAWTMGIDLTAQVHLVRACLDDLRRNGDGRVVNIASTEGLGATGGNSPYVAAKHGVVGLTRALAVEFGREGVTFNCVCPGAVQSQMTAHLPEDAKTKFARRRIPAGRYGEPEEIAHMTLSLVLPASSYVNGAVIPVDGGLLCQNT